MNRALTLTLLLAVLALAPAAIAGGTAASAEPASANVRCLPVGASALRAIRSGLHASLRSKLRARSTRAVKARGDFSDAPLGIGNGIYFVSANLRGTGVATWAVSTSFYRAGGGLIYAVGKLARRVSVFGSNLPPSVLERWGISTGTYGYAQSRACVK